MLRILSFIAVFLMLCAGQAQAVDTPCPLKNSGTAGGNQMYMPFPAALKRGMNLSGWWQEGQQTPLTEADLHRIHDLGFDFVRLPVSPTWLEMSDYNEQKQKTLQLHCDIVSLLNEGFTVIIDMHPSESYKTNLFNHPEEAIPHIEKIWRKMQQVVTELPSWRVYLELFNEPLMESDSWWHLQEKIIDDLRPVFPGNTFVASPGPFNGWWELSGKIPYKDVNVIYDFHFYEPIYLTRHGEDNAGQAASQSPIVYPVDKTFNFNMNDPEVQKYVTQAWDKSALAVILKEASAWRDHYNAVTVCLEFGIDRPHNDSQSRYNWLRDVQDNLDDVDIPWAVWDYRGPSGIVDSQGALDTGMLDALNLKKASLQ